MKRKLFDFYRQLNTNAPNHPYYSIITSALETEVLSYICKARGPQGAFEGHSGPLGGPIWAAKRAAEQRRDGGGPLGPLALPMLSIYIYIYIYICIYIHIYIFDIHFGFSHFGPRRRPRWGPLLHEPLCDLSQNGYGTYIHIYIYICIYTRFAYGALRRLWIRARQRSKQ